LIRLDLDRRMFFDFPQCIELIARHRLLKNLYAVVGQSLRQSDGGLGVIGFVGVHLDEHAATHRIPHRCHARQILVDLSAHLELERQTLPYHLLRLRRRAPALQDLRGRGGPGPIRPASTGSC